MPQETKKPLEGKELEAAISEIEVLIRECAEKYGVDGPPHVYPVIISYADYNRKGIFPAIRRWYIRRESRKVIALHLAQRIKERDTT